MKTIAMFGVRRSGNHALQEKIFREAGGGVLYNDMKYPLPVLWKTQTSKIRRFGDGPLTIISFEDIPEQVVPQADENLVLIRSVYNAFASRICATTQTLFNHRMKNFDEAMAAWLHHSHRYTHKYETLDLGEVRKHRPSFEDTDYNARWKRVGECQWDGWEKYWRHLLRNDAIRDAQHRLYGWTLNRDGQILS